MKLKPTRDGYVTKVIKQGKEQRQVTRIWREDRPVESDDWAERTLQKSRFANQSEEVREAKKKRALERRLHKQRKRRRI